MDLRLLPLLFSIFAGLVIALGGHIFVWRRHPGSDPRMGTLAGLAILGLCTSLGISFDRWRGNPEAFLFLVSGSLFFITAYFFFYAGIARSVSITLMEKLLQMRELSFSSLATDYERSTRFEQRLTHMQKAGWISRTHDHVSLTDRGRQVIHLIQCLARLISATLEG